VRPANPRPGQGFLGPLEGSVKAGLLGVDTSPMNSGVNTASPIRRVRGTRQPPAVRPTTDEVPVLAADGETGDERASAPVPSGLRGAVPLFCAAAALPAALGFVLEPMIVKRILPMLGGSPSVWNTSMVFFQTTLLLGYVYTHLTTRWSLRRHGRIHLAMLLLPLLVLPTTLPNWTPPAGEPIGWLALLLTVCVGAPYLATTTANPLLQRWFSASSHPRAHDPYFLAAASNTGSLLGLLAYPVLIEPRLTLSQQATWWTIGYILFVVITASAFFVSTRRKNESVRSHTSEAATPETVKPETVKRETATTQIDEPIVSWGRRIRWLLLAFIPTSTTMGATTFLTTDVASVPMLWVMPLAAYLLTFIIAFGRRHLIRVATLERLAMASTAIAFWFSTKSTFLGVGANVLVVFTVGLLCHNRLSKDRPGPAKLTEYFMIVSIGGVLAGIFNTLVAPRIFTYTLEYPLALLGSVFIAAPRRKKGKPMRPAAILLTTAIVIGTVVAAAVFVRPSGYQHRDFYGTLRIVESPAERVLIHGTTVHGVQLRDPAKAQIPTSYYSRSGPLGQLFSALTNSPLRQQVGAVGLGVGVAASYTRAGDSMRYYELDPEDARVAADPSKFTFLSDAKGKVDVVVGDARLKLADEPNASFGVLIVDAFSSDAIPTHLLTTQAVQMYLTKLKANGVIAFHISNYHVDLEPVIGKLASTNNLSARVFSDFSGTPGGAEEHKLASIWMVVARSPQDLKMLEGHGNWKVPRTTKHRVWTDDFSDVFSAIRK
jgi:spermidine synthase